MSSLMTFLYLESGIFEYESDILKHVRRTLIFKKKNQKLIQLTDPYTHIHVI